MPASSEEAPAAPGDVPVQAPSLDSPEAGARFIRGSVMRVLTYGVSLLASLVSAPLVIRHLGPSRYGYYATVTAIVFVVGGFTEAGLNVLGIREFATGRSDKVRLLRNLVGLRVTGTAVALVLVAGIAALVGSRQVIAVGVLLAGAGLIVTIAGENYGIPLSSNLRLGAVSLLALAQQITLSIVLIALVVSGAGILPLLAATVASGAVLLGGTGFLIRGEVPVTPAFDRRMWASMLRETLPYALASAVGMIYFREALILTSVLTSERQVSYYGAAFRIVEVLTVIPWTVISGAFPILSRAAHLSDDSRLGYGLQRLFDTATVAGVWMAGSIAVGASFGIAVVAGHGFGPAVPVLQIQGLAVITSFMVAVFGSLLLSLRMFGALLRANALAVATATVLSLVLIPLDGARGAAIAPTASEACLAIAYAWSLRRARPGLAVSLRIFPRVMLAAAIALGVTVALPISSAAGLFVFGAGYAAACAALKIIPFEVVNALLRRRPRPPDSGRDGTVD